MNTLKIISTVVLALIVVTTVEYVVFKTHVKDINKNFTTAVTHYEKLLEIKHKPKIKYITKSGSKDTFIEITEEDLIQDLILTYKGISTQTKKVIVNTIQNVSETYNINPLILYSLIHVESSFRFWKEHPQRTIKWKGKSIKIKAVGLGGIVWEIHGDNLKANKIASVRSDLFNPEVNIKAIGFIYNKYRETKLHPSASNPDESAMLRYFGGSYKSYVKAINDKISKIIYNKLYKSKENE